MASAVCNAPNLVVYAAPNLVVEVGKPECVVPKTNPDGSTRSTSAHYRTRFRVLSPRYPGSDCDRVYDCYTDDENIEHIRRDAVAFAAQTFHWEHAIDPCGESLLKKDFTDYEGKPDETVADILSDAFRRFFVHSCDECEYRKCCDYRFCDQNCDDKRRSISLLWAFNEGGFAKLLARIDAAVKRERDLLVNAGNAAAFRAALENVERVARFCAETPRFTSGYPTDAARADVLYSRIVELGRVARAALAAPARNCDRFATANDAVEGYIAAHPHDDEPDASTYGSWLFAPAQEGGAK